MADFAAGVTIKVNNVEATITSAIRQADHAVVHYVLDTPVASTDTVTYSYSKPAGHIVAETGGAALADVAAQTVTNNVSGELTLPQVASGTLLLDLRASQLSLTDGDPVSTWADASGRGHDFAQTGSARPLYKVVDGIPCVEFDGVDDYLLGQNWLEFDNLNSFSLFVVSDGAGCHITKINNTSNGAGWAIYGSGSTGLIQEAGGSKWIEKDLIPFDPPLVLVSTLELVSKSEMHIYLNGDNSAETDSSTPPVSDYSTAEPVRLGVLGNLYAFPGGQLYAVLFYSPAPNATDRAAIEAWLAQECGIVL